MPFSRENPQLKAAIDQKVLTFVKMGYEGGAKQRLPELGDNFWNPVRTAVMDKFFQKTSRFSSHYILKENVAGSLIDGQKIFCTLKGGINITNQQVSEWVGQENLAAFVAGVTALESPVPTSSKPLLPTPSERQPKAAVSTSTTSTVQTAGPTDEAEQAVLDRERQEEEERRRQQEEKERLEREKEVEVRRQQQEEADRRQKQEEEERQRLQREEDRKRREEEALRQQQEERKRQEEEERLRHQEEELKQRRQEEEERLQREREAAEAEEPDGWSGVEQTVAEVMTTPVGSTVASKPDAIASVPDDNRSRSSSASSQSSTASGESGISDSGEKGSSSDEEHSGSDKKGTEVSDGVAPLPFLTPRPITGGKRKKLRSSSASFQSSTAFGKSDFDASKGVKLEIKLIKSEKKALNPKIALIINAIRGQLIAMGIFKPNELPTAEDDFNRRFGKVWGKFYRELPRCSLDTGEEVAVAIQNHIITVKQKGTGAKDQVLEVKGRRVLWDDLFGRLKLMDSSSSVKFDAVALEEHLKACQFMMSEQVEKILSALKGRAQMMGSDFFWVITRWLQTELSEEREKQQKAESDAVGSDCYINNENEAKLRTCLSSQPYTIEGIVAGVEKYFGFLDDVTMGTRILKLLGLDPNQQQDVNVTYRMRYQGSETASSYADDILSMHLNWMQKGSITLKQADLILAALKTRLLTFDPSQEQKSAVEHLFEQYQEGWKEELVKVGFLNTSGINGKILSGIPEQEHGKWQTKISEALGWLGYEEEGILGRYNLLHPEASVRVTGGTVLTEHLKALKARLMTYEEAGHVIDALNVRLQQSGLSSLSEEEVERLKRELLGQSYTVSGIKVAIVSAFAAEQSEKEEISFMGKPAIDKGKAPLEVADDGVKASPRDRSEKKRNPYELMQLLVLDQGEQGVLSGYTLRQFSEWPTKFPDRVVTRQMLTDHFANLNEGLMTKKEADGIIDALQGRMIAHGLNTAQVQSWIIQNRHDLRYQFMQYPYTLESLMANITPVLAIIFEKSQEFQSILNLAQNIFHLLMYPDDHEERILAEANALGEWLDFPINHPRIEHVCKGVLDGHFENLRYMSREEANLVIAAVRGQVIGLGGATVLGGAVNPHMLPEINDWSWDGLRKLLMKHYFTLDGIIEALKAFRGYTKRFVVNGTKVTTSIPIHTMLAALSSLVVEFQEESKAKVVEASQTKHQKSRPTSQPMIKRQSYYDLRSKLIKLSCHDITPGEVIKVADAVRGNAVQEEESGRFRGSTLPSQWPTGEDKSWNPLRNVLCQTGTACRTYTLASLCEQPQDQITIRDDYEGDLRSYLALRADDGKIETEEDLDRVLRSLAVHQMTLKEALYVVNALRGAMIKSNIRDAVQLPLGEADYFDQSLNQVWQALIVSLRSQNFTVAGLRRGITAYCAQQNGQFVVGDITLSPSAVEQLLDTFIRRDRDRRAGQWVQNLRAAAVCTQQDSLLGGYIVSRMKLMCGQNVLSSDEEDKLKRAFQGGCKWTVAGVKNFVGQATEVLQSAEQPVQSGRRKKGSSKTRASKTRALSFHLEQFLTYLMLDGEKAEADILREYNVRNLNEPEQEKLGPRHFVDKVVLEKHFLFLSIGFMTIRDAELVVDALCKRAQSMGGKYQALVNDDLLPDRASKELFCQCLMRESYTSDGILTAVQGYMGKHSELCKELLAFDEVLPGYKLRHTELFLQGSPEPVYNGRLLTDHLQALKEGKMLSSQAEQIALVYHTRTAAYQGASDSAGDSLGRPFEQTLKQRLVCQPYTVSGIRTAVQNEAHEGEGARVLSYLALNDVVSGCQYRYPGSTSQEATALGLAEQEVTGCMLQDHFSSMLPVEGFRPACMTASEVNLVVEAFIARAKFAKMFETFEIQEANIYRFEELLKQKLIRSLLTVEDIRTCIFEAIQKVFPRADQLVSIIKSGTAHRTFEETTSLKKYVEKLLDESFTDELVREGYRLRHEGVASRYVQLMTYLEEMKQYLITLPEAERIFDALIGRRIADGADSNELVRNKNVFLCCLMRQPYSDIAVQTGIQDAWHKINKVDPTGDLSDREQLDMQRMIDLLLRDCPVISLSFDVLDQYFSERARTKFQEAELIINALRTRLVTAKLITEEQWQNICLQADNIIDRFGRRLQLGYFTISAIQGAVLEIFPREPTTQVAEDVTRSYDDICRMLALDKRDILLADSINQEYSQELATMNLDVTIRHFERLSQGQMTLAEADLVCNAIYGRWIAEGMIATRDLKEKVGLCDTDLLRKLMKQPFTMGGIEAGIHAYKALLSYLRSEDKPQMLKEGWDELSLFEGLSPDAHTNILRTHLETTAAHMRVDEAEHVINALRGRLIAAGLPVEEVMGWIDGQCKSLQCYLSYGAFYAIDSHLQYCDLKNPDLWYRIGATRGSIQGALCCQALRDFLRNDEGLLERVITFFFNASSVKDRYETRYHDKKVSAHQMLDAHLDELAGMTREEACLVINAFRSWAITNEVEGAESWPEAEVDFYNHSQEDRFWKFNDRIGLVEQLIAQRENGFSSAGIEEVFNGVIDKPLSDLHERFEGALKDTVARINLLKKALQHLAIHQMTPTNACLVIDALRASAIRRGIPGANRLLTTLADQDLRRYDWQRIYDLLIQRPFTIKGIQDALHFERLIVEAGHVRVEIPSPYELLSEILEEQPLCHTDAQLIERLNRLITLPGMTFGEAQDVIRFMELVEGISLENDISEELIGRLHKQPCTALGVLKVFKADVLAVEGTSIPCSPCLKFRHLLSVINRQENLTFYNCVLIALQNGLEILSETIKLPVNRPFTSIPFPSEQPAERADSYTLARMPRGSSLRDGVGGGSLRGTPRTSTGGSAVVTSSDPSVTPSHMEQRRFFDSSTTPKTPKMGSTHTNLLTSSPRSPCGRFGSSSSSDFWGSSSPHRRTETPCTQTMRSGKPGAGDSQLLPSSLTGGRQRRKSFSDDDEGSSPLYRSNGGGGL